MEAKAALDSTRLPLVAAAIWSQCAPSSGCCLMHWCTRLAPRGRLQGGGGTGPTTTSPTRLQVGCGDSITLQHVAFRVGWLSVASLVGAGPRRFLGLHVKGLLPKPYSTRSSTSCLLLLSFSLCSCSLCSLCLHESELVVLLAIALDGGAGLRWKCSSCTLDC